MKTCKKLLSMLLCMLFIFGTAAGTMYASAGGYQESGYWKEASFDDSNPEEYTNINTGYNKGAKFIVLYYGGSMVNYISTGETFVLNNASDDIYNLGFIKESVYYSANERHNYIFGVCKDKYDTAPEWFKSAVKSKDNTPCVLFIDNKSIQACCADDYNDMADMWYDTFKKGDAFTGFKNTAYMVNIDLNGGNVHPYWKEGPWGNGELKLPEEVDRDGYTALGFSRNKNATTADYSLGGTINVTDYTYLYVIWKKNSTPSTPKGRIELEKTEYTVNAGEKVNIPFSVYADDASREVNIAVKSDNESIAKVADLSLSIPRSFNAEGISGGETKIKMILTDRATGVTLDTKEVNIKVEGEGAAGIFGFLGFLITPIMFVWGLIVTFFTFVAGAFAGIF